MADYSGANSATTLNGLFKEVYEDNLKRLIPDGKKILQKIKFVSKDRMPGNAYHQPVVLGMEHGVTFADDTEGAFALNPPVAGQIKDAVVKGYQLVLRSAMPYAQASRSMGPGERAFEEATKYLVGSMLDSVMKKLEIEALYGQKEYGLVEGVATGLVIPITDAEFAPGIWSGSTNMPIEIYDTTLATLRGGVGATIASVDLTAKTITLSAGDAAVAAAVVATDRILHKGAKSKEFAGIHSILANTGTLFGISASQFDLWKGSSFAPSSTSVLSFAILQQAISKGVEKGLDTDVMVMVNPGHWDDLLTEQAALRMYDSSYSSADAENGSKAIKFHSQNGMVEIVPSIYVKEGYAYVLCLEDWVRVGSTDVTFKRPGQEGNFFRELEDHAGYELRCYTDQAIFCSRPGRSILISNLKVS
jgi:hypothetical protein